MYVWGVKNAQCKCNFAVFSIVSENEPIELQNKTSPVLNGVNMAKLCDTRFFNNSVWPKVGPPETQCPILNYAFSFTYNRGPHELHMCQVSACGLNFFIVKNMFKVTIQMYRMTWRSLYMHTVYLHRIMWENGAWLFILNAKRPQAETCHKWSSWGPLQQMKLSLHNSISDIGFSPLQYLLSSYWSLRKCSLIFKTHDETIYGRNIESFRGANFGPNGIIQKAGVA